VEWLVKANVCEDIESSIELSQLLFKSGLFYSILDTNKCFTADKELYRLLVSLPLCHALIFFREMINILDV
jgi:hypothetical protein